MKLKWTVLPLAFSCQECPRLWHKDEVTGNCRPGIDHVSLKCSGDLIEVEFNNLIFDQRTEITVNSCTDGVEVTEQEYSRQILIQPEVCDSHIHFEEKEVILRNYINVDQRGVVYSIPVDCVFQRTNDHTSGNSEVSRSRRAAVKTAHSKFEIKLQYVDSVFSGPLPFDKRLIVGEDAHVVVGLQHRIKGIEMAVTNCTVFDEDYSHKYSIVDFPRKWF